MRKKAKRDLTIEQQLARGPLDLPYLALVLLLTAIGLIMLLSASYASAYYNLDAVDTGGNPYYYFLGQLKFAIAGVVIMYVVSKFDYQRWRLLSVPALAGSIFLLLLVFTPLGRSSNGARRWLDIGFSFQPSELAKVAVVLFFAASLSKRKDQIKAPPKKWNRRTRRGRLGEFAENIGLLELIPYALILLVILFLLYKQPHMSGMILVCSGAAAVLFASGIRLYWFVGGGSLVAAALVFLITQTEYMTARIQSWLDPLSDLQGDGYQLWQSQIAIGSGGLLGLGLGNSRQKYMFLPEEHNDFVFAIVCEELGLIGACLIIVLFALLIIRGYWLALHARDRFGSLLIVGINTQLAAQVICNIGVVTGALPTTGISLPFFSYGGTALVVQLAEVGLILAVSRQIVAPKVE